MKHTFKTTFPSRVLLQVALLLGALWACMGATVAVADPGVAGNPFLQYGALGILAFMVWTNSKERKYLFQVMEEKDKDIEALFSKLTAYEAKMTGLAEKMVEAVAFCRRNQGD